MERLGGCGSKVEHPKSSPKMTVEPEIGLNTEWQRRQGEWEGRLGCKGLEKKNGLLVHFGAERTLEHGLPGNVNMTSECRDVMEALSLPLDCCSPT